MNRRAIMGGLAAVLAGGLGFWRLGMRHYPDTPYDDLLDQIQDREAAATLGNGISRPLPVDTMAVRLRARRKLALQAQADAAAGKTAEIGGWVLPESLALYASLAAHFKP